MLTNEPAPAPILSDIDIATVRVELHAALRRARAVLEHTEIALLLTKHGYVDGGHVQDFSRIEGQFQRWQSRAWRSPA
jgi:hypothetical protein